jgi:hypothetical protein
VIRIVLIHHRIHDIANDYGLDMVEKYVYPHTKNSNGKAIANEQDRFVSESVANRDGGNRETCVRENHGPPAEVKVKSPLVDNLC